MLEVDTYLVRHGSYDDTPAKELDERGREQSEQAAQTLLSYGLGASALVLSSDLPRTMTTAQIIADRLSAGEVVPSYRMNVGGNDEDLIEDLDHWITAALVEAGATLEDKEGLVVVTHEPLIKTAVLSMTGQSSRIRNGQVVAYKPGSWNNPDFDAEWATRAEADISRHGS